MPNSLRNAIELTSEAQSLIAQIAVALTSEEARSALNLLDHLGVIMKPETNSYLFLRPMQLPETLPSRLGPWSLDENGLHYRLSGENTYSADKRWPSQSGAWAKVDTIPVKRRGTYRVVLVGESVARGFFLDPVCSVGQLLQHFCQDMDSSKTYEVVDLAVNNLNIFQSMELCEIAALLDPNLLIVYTGNNWIRSVDWQDTWYTSGRPESWTQNLQPYYLEARNRTIGKIAGEFAAFLSAWHHKTGVPVLQVIPEVNRMDWHEPWQIPFWLAPQQLRRWLKTYDRVRQLELDLEHSALSALNACQELSDIDRCTTARTLEVMARAHVYLGNLPVARQLFDQSINIGARPGPGRSRRCPPFIADAMRHAAQTYHIALVDLPQLLSKLTTDHPHWWGRHNFLDYCHHTPLSLQTVARAIATRIIPSESMTSMPSPSGETIDLFNNPKALAEVYFLAAVHNAHWGQPQHIIAHWVKQSVTSDQEITHTFRMYMNLTAKRTPPWLEPKLYNHPESLVSWYLTNYLTEWSLDASLGEILSEVHQQQGSVSLRETFAENRIGLLAVEQAGSINLLDRYWATGESFQTLIEPNSVWRATVPISEFTFVSEAIHDIVCSVVARGGYPLEIDSVLVTVNDLLISEQSIDCNWQSWSFRIPQSFLIKGVNRLVWQWRLSADGLSDNHPTVGDHLSGRPPCFGEFLRFELGVDSPNHHDVMIKPYSSKRNINAVSAH